MPLAQWIEQTGLLQLQCAIKDGTTIKLTPQGREWVRTQRIRRLSKGKKPKAKHRTPEQHRQDALTHKAHWDAKRQARADAPQPVPTEQDRKRLAPMWDGSRWVWPWDAGFSRAVQAQAKRNTPRQDKPKTAEGRGPFYLPPWLPKLW